MIQVAMHVVRCDLIAGSTRGRLRRGNRLLIARGRRRVHRSRLLVITRGRLVIRGRRVILGTLSVAGRLRVAGLLLIVGRRIVRWRRLVGRRLVCRRLVRVGRWRGVSRLLRDRRRGYRERHERHPCSKQIAAHCSHPCPGWEVLPPEAAEGPRYYTRPDATKVMTTTR